MLLGPQDMNDPHSCDIVGFGQIPYEFVFVSQVALSTMSRWHSIKVTKTKSPIVRSTLSSTYLFYQFYMLLKVLLHCIRIFPVEFSGPIPIVDPPTMNDCCSIVYVFSRWNFWIQPIVDPPAMNDPEWYDNVRFEPNSHEFVLGTFPKDLILIWSWIIYMLVNTFLFFRYLTWDVHSIVLFLYYED